MTQSALSLSARISASVSKPSASRSPVTLGLDSASAGSGQPFEVAGNKPWVAKALRDTGRSAFFDCGFSRGRPQAVRLLRIRRAEREAISRISSFVSGSCASLRNSLVQSLFTSRAITRRAPRAAQLDAACRAGTRFTAAIGRIAEAG